MGLLASLKVMLGIDSVDYQGKLRSAGTLTTAFAADTERVGQRLKSSITGPLVLAGLAAEKFGGQLTSTFMDAAGVTSKLAVQTNGLMLATGRLADTTLLAVASLGRLSNVKLSTKAIDAAVVGLGVAAAETGWAVGRLVAETTGLDEALRDKAGKPAAELAEVLARDETRFQNVAGQVAHLKERLGLLGPEWNVTNVRTRENAARLVEVNDRILTLIRSKRDLSGVLANYIKGQEGVEGAHRRNIATLEAVKASWNATMGVMSRTEVLSGFTKLAENMKKMAEQGIPWQQVMTAVAPKFKELSDYAATYTDLNLPQQARDLATAFGDETGAAMDAYLRKVASIPDATRKASADNAVALAELEEKFKNGVKGGLTDGAREGLNEMQKQLAAWTAANRLELNVSFNLANLASELARLGIKAPNVPNVSGSVGAGG